ncbi:MAG TPA: peptidoglycan-binding protein [Nitriliruptorales bacterium]
MQPIRLGSAGPEVTDVQRRLSALGHLTDPDDPGVYGRTTESAVKAFQQDRGLPADGIVGEDTWKVLVEASYELGDRNLWLRRPMMRGDDVRELQQRLNRLGFDAGQVDGIFGRETEAALREFQVNVARTEDGIAGSDTVAALRRLHRQHQSVPSFSVKEREQLRGAGRPSIAGARVMVDPGHGPDDPGFVASAGAVAEHEVNWHIASRLAGRLGALGCSVTLSRGPRTTPSTSERARLANDDDVEAVISLRVNGMRSERAHGAAAYYYGRGDVISEAGRRFAQLAIDHVVQETGTLNCRTHPSSAGLLRETRAPAIIVEPGFLSHPDEGAKLQTPSYQEAIVRGLTEATLAFLTGHRLGA